MSDDPNTPMAKSDNSVVASEVMSSAIRILALLVLSDREIAELFQAESSEGTGLEFTTPTVDDDDKTEARPWRLDALADSRCCLQGGRAVFRSVLVVSGYGGECEAVV